MTELFYSGQVPVRELWKKTFIRSEKDVEIIYNKSISIIFKIYFVPFV